MIDIKLTWSELKTILGTKYLALQAYRKSSPTVKLIASDGPIIYICNINNQSDYDEYVNNYEVFANQRIDIATGLKRFTYGAAISGLTPANNTTDVFTLTGSSTKTIKVLRIGVSGSANDDTNIPTAIIRRSTANSGGTSTTPTAVAFDTTNVSATATPRAYTANPTLGTTVGSIITKQISLADVAAGLGSTVGIAADPYYFDQSEYGQPITLRGTSQVLAINLLGVAPQTGQTMDIYMHWTEE